MMVGPGKWIVLIVVMLLLFGYKKLPAISRSIGQSFRIARSELKGLDPNDVRTRARAQTGRGKLGEYRRSEQPPTEPQPAAEQNDAEERPDDER
ncbi:MAG TPA: twin-arginine translocase TatA/TatE family subunit [Mycobacteriales bacterium]|nr:twin-arginine translocase TatA/TatE family subunit [Mycobacteriales bacterium]